MSLHVDVIINSPAWESLPFDAAAVAEDITKLAYQKAVRPAILQNRDTELSVVLSDNEEVQILNRDYRGKDKPTNVLSFAALDDEESLTLIPQGESLPVGDIIISYQVLKEESAHMGVTFQDHYTHILIHGTLHVLGYDHENEDDATLMESLEIQILAGLGIKNPYTHDKFMA